MTAARPPDRTRLIGDGVARVAVWSARVVLIALGAVLVGVVVGRAWVVILPVVLAVIVATLLAPPASFLRRHGWPSALAATVTVVVGLGLIVGVIALITPPVVDQAVAVADSAAGGLQRLQDWLTGPPLNLDDGQLTAATNEITARLQANAATIATGVLTGVSAVTSVVVTLVLVIILVFFFVKDGTRFLPWLSRSVGPRAGRHLDALLRRWWDALGGFIRIQALVGLIDAVLIGLGLVITGTPLALPLAVLTFIGGFIPIIGAFVAGGLAVLVALVTGGFVKALIVLAIIVAVQQLEGNVLQPVLQSKSLKLHPAIVLLAVTGGGSLFGIIGAFLAVPVVAVVAETIRYLGEQLDARTGQGSDPDGNDDDGHGGAGDGDGNDDDGDGDGDGDGASDTTHAEHETEDDGAAVRG